MLFSSSTNLKKFLDIVNLTDSSEALNDAQLYVNLVIDCHSARQSIDLCGADDAL